MTEIGRFIKIANDPSQNPDGFRGEVERIFQDLMEQIDALRGLRGDNKQYNTLTIVDSDGEVVHSFDISEEG